MDRIELWSYECGRADECGGDATDFPQAPAEFTRSAVFNRGFIDWHKHLDIDFNESN